MHRDPQAIPTRYIFTLGPNTPIVTGPNNASGGGTFQIVVSEIYVEFQSYTLEVGTQVGGSGAEVGTGGAGPTSDLVCDIEQSLDQGATWSSVFGGNQAIMPVLPGGRVSQLTPDANFGTRVEFGTYLRTNVIAAGGGEAQNVVLTANGYCLES